jgi:hypothetical protein
MRAPLGSGAAECLPNAAGAARRVAAVSEIRPRITPAALFAGQYARGADGVARPSLNTVLKDFERRGFLGVGYASVRLLDLDALRRIRAD